MHDGEIAGFCLVRELGPDRHQMVEFYILEPHRRAGVGRHAARAALALFPGQWEVAQEAHNKVAQQFWRQVIGEVSDGRFEESWSDSQPSGPMQSFTISAD
jgi:predicted acetyltransferase